MNPPILHQSLFKAGKTGDHATSCGPEFHRLFRQQVLGKTSACKLLPGSDDLVIQLSEKVTFLSNIHSWQYEEKW